MAAPSLLDPLRPKPFRGDVIAAGAVVLATLAWTVAARFEHTWGPGAHLAYAGVAWAFVTTLALLAPLEGDEPRAYQSVLYVAAVALCALALGELSAVLGRHGAVHGSGDATWVAAVLSAFALGFAVRRNSAVCTLIGAVAGGIAVLAAVTWIWSPHGATADRWVLLGLMVVYGFAAIGQRDRRPRHGVALIDAAGLAVLVIAASFLLGALVVDADRIATIPRAGWGWELLMVAAGFGLIAYSSVDRQPGPAYLGVLNLIAFALLTARDAAATGATLIGWPLVLAAAALLLLAIGLRPTTPAPPPPDVDAPEPPPLPWR